MRETDPLGSMYVCYFGDERKAILQIKQEFDDSWRRKSLPPGRVGFAVGVA